MEHIVGYFTNASSIQIYGLIFVMLMAGSFGMPFPEEMVFLSVGYAAYMGWINPVVGAVCGFVSVLIGDTTIYFLGNKLGLRICSLPLLRVVITKKAIEKGHSFLNKYGSEFVFFSKFVVGLRYSVFFASGMMSIGYKRFISFDALASMITIPLLVSLAYYNGHEIDIILAAVKYAYNWILIAALTGISVFLIVNRVHKRIKRTTSR
ncbi:MAG: DedA family protein [Pseudomonadota bacterium]